MSRRVKTENISVKTEVIPATPESSSPQCSPEDKNNNVSNIKTPGDYSEFSQSIEGTYTSTPVTRRTRSIASISRNRKLGISRLPQKLEKTTNKAIKKRRKTKVDSLARYIHKVHQAVNPDLKISARAMDTMESFMCDMFHRLACDASQLKQKANKQTINAADIEFATKLVIPGRLSNYAVQFGKQRLKQYHENR